MDESFSDAAMDESFSHAAMDEWAHYEVSTLPPPSPPTPYTQGHMSKYDCTERSTPWQAGRHSVTQAGRQAGRQALCHPGRQADRHLGRQAGRQALCHPGRQAGRQAGRGLNLFNHTPSTTHTHSHTHTQHTHTQSHTHTPPYPNTRNTECPSLTATAWLAAARTHLHGVGRCQHCCAGRQAGHKARLGHAHLLLLHGLQEGLGGQGGAQHSREGGGGALLRGQAEQGGRGGGEGSSPGEGQAQNGRAGWEGGRGGSSPGEGLVQNGRAWWEEGCAAAPPHTYKRSCVSGPNTFILGWHSTANQYCNHYRYTVLQINQ